MKKQKANDLQGGGEIYIRGLRQQSWSKTPAGLDEIKLLRRLDEEKGERKIWDLEKELADEVKDAENSAYYWWWRFLQESEDYKKVLQGKKVEPAVKAVAKDFGNVLDKRFEEWWLLTGRYLFAQERPIPVLMEVEQGFVAYDKKKAEALYIEVPLRMRRGSALRHINQLLGKYFRGEKGERHNPYKFSKAKRDINKSSKMRLKTFKQFHDVWLDREWYPASPWWETGQRLKISPAFINGPHTNPLDRRHNNRMMDLTVQRIYRKTERLIYNAARGEFPKVT